MKQYFDAVAVEKKWYDFWVNNDYFVPKKLDSVDNFSMVIPPPNVTGTLHMGHAFQLSIMDALWRYHRMNGRQSLWQLGMDHAGIATQLVVDNILKQKGKDRITLGRDEFVKEIWKWKQYSGDTIINQQKCLGIAGDWDNLRFTLDPDFSQVVSKVFIQLYEQGLIYRGKRLVNWDPVLKTAISDLEVLSQEEDGSLWYIKYVVDDQDLIIATTRPETLFGDVAIAVNPGDERFSHLIGKMVVVPLCGREIPIIADEYVEMGFGSGCVKITPAHDFNDYSIGLKHNLPFINILTQDARLNDQVPSEFRGLTVLEARSKVTELLELNNLLVKTENYRHKVPRGDRSGAVIEPYLTDQWFIRMKPLALPAIEALKSGKLVFMPENWGKVYLQWLENIEDWCISRQLWWGHRIPAWYNEAGEIFVGENEDQIRKKYSVVGNLIQDEDVLDTWFSAALWPFVTLGWPEENNFRYRNFYPTSVLVTGFDIIFFWVSRMVMFGLKFTGEVPFKTVYITGLIRDARGQKMSKSKGNIIDPIDLINGISLDELLKKRTSFLMQKHLIGKIEKDTKKDFPNGIESSGTDALRFALCSLATMNMNINFQMDRLLNSKHLVTKIWNAARYILKQLPQDFTLKEVITLNPIDFWINQKFNTLVSQVKNWMEQYRFDLVCRGIYEFFWEQFCDWYLEFCKVLLSSEILEEYKYATLATLVRIMEKFLRLIHPILPFISEELWQKFKKYINNFDEESILLSAYPRNILKENAENYLTIEWIKKVIINIRNVKSEFVLPKTTAVYLKSCEHQYSKNLLLLDNYFALTGMKSFNRDSNLTSGYALVVDEGIELAIEIPKERVLSEKKRLENDLFRLNKEKVNLTEKLENVTYVNKAPIEVVSRDRERLNVCNCLINKVLQQLKSIV